MVDDSLIAPGVRVAPADGIHVDASVIEGWDFKVLLKVNALGASVRVAKTGVVRVEPALIAEGYAMARV